MFFLFSILHNVKSKIFILCFFSNIFSSGFFLNIVQSNHYLGIKPSFLDIKNPLGLDKITEEMDKYEAEINKNKHTNYIQRCYCNEFNLYRTLYVKEHVNNYLGYSLLLYGTYNLSSYAVENLKKNNLINPLFDIFKLKNLALFGVPFYFGLNYINDASIAERQRLIYHRLMMIEVMKNKNEHGDKCYNFLSRQVLINNDYKYVYNMLKLQEHELMMPYDSMFIFGSLWLLNKYKRKEKMSEIIGKIVFPIICPVTFQEYYSNQFYKYMDNRYQRYVEIDKMSPDDAYKKLSLHAQFYSLNFKESKLPEYCIGYYADNCFAKYKFNYEEDRWYTS